MSIASRITAIEEHIRDVYDTIDYSYDTTDVDKNIINIPQNIFNGYINVLNDNGQSLWNALEKVSQADVEETELENVVTAPMKISLKGNTSQDGTPTPDTPVEVKVVKGENVVSVSGKNLFNSNVNNYTISNTGEFVNGSDRLACDYEKISGNKITFSQTSGSGFFGVAFYDNNKNYISRFISGSVVSSITSDIPSGATYVRAFIQLPNNETANAQSIEKYKMMLELNSTATPYVPYSKTDYPINLGDIELCKINTYKDYLFKRNGKWYKYKAIGKVVFNGSEEKWFQSGNYFRIQISNSKSGTNCRSNYFVAGNQDNQFFVYADNYLGFRYGVLNNILADWKTWLSTHNTIVYYALITPTEEEITNSTLIEQLEAISKAKSVKDKTYITQTNEELPFILDVEAIKEYSVE